MVEPARPPLLAPDAERRRLMQRVRQKGTDLENEVAAICRRLGVHYRRNVGALPGSPDLANQRNGWAVFVNGCFWHHHTACRLATIPARNADFWREKLAANRRRDAGKIRELRRRGFRVVLVWQCELAAPVRLEARLAQCLAVKRRERGERPAVRRRSGAAPARGLATIEGSG